MSTRWSLVALIPVVLAACTTTSSPGPAPDVDQAAVPAAGGEPAYMTAVAALRREPVDEQKTQDKTNKADKKPGNYLTTLQRGETVTVLEKKPNWVHIKAADEMQGWVRADSVVTSAGVKPVTVLEEIGTYDRPQLVAINPKHKLPIGALLFALRTKDQFSEVDLGGGRTTWVKTDNLQSDNVDVEVAKMLAKADWLAKQDAAAAAEVKASITAQFPGSRLLKALEPAADKAAEPTPAPATPPPPSP